MSNSVDRPPVTFEQLLRHVVGTQGYPDVSIEIPPDTPPTEEDIALAGRLIRSWERATSAERGVNRAFGDVWEMVQFEFHGEFVAAMQSRDSHAVAKILVRFFRHNISYGMGGGQVVFDAVRDPQGNRQVA